MSDGASENVVRFDAASRREAPSTALQIVGRCRNLTTAHMERCLKTMLDNTDDTLFKLAEQAENNRTQTEYFDAMREVRRKRSTMESEYPMQIARVFDGFLRGAGPANRNTRITDDDLSLVEKDELEENLALQGMVSKAVRIHDNDLYILTRRLAVAVDRPKLGEDAHPLAPAALCEAFRSAMDVLDVDLRVRLIIYKLFDKYVVSQLADLYREVNQALAERGILPELRSRSSTQQIRRPGQGAGIPGAGHAAHMEEFEDDGVEGGDLAALLQQLAGRSSVGAMPFGGGGGGSVGLVNPSMLLGAINQFTAVTPSSGQVLSGDELKGAILSSVNSGGHTGLVLNRMDETAIDIVSMLFDFIFADPALPAPIKELIGRLQIPVLRVAILDKTFFSRKKHPARRLLNELARAGIGWTEAEEREDGLKTRIESVVERLSEDFDGDVGLFEQELLAFQEWCRDQAERAAQREEHSALAAQGREHLRVAKGVAEEAINRVVDGQPLPEPVVGLLRNTWQDLLVLIYLKDGQHGKLWQKALNVASLLVWSLLPKATQAERDQLTGMLPSLLRALQEGMTRMSCSEAEQQSMLALLANEHARLVRDPDMSLEVAPGQPARTDHPGDTPADVEATSAARESADADSRAGVIEDAPASMDVLEGDNTVPHDGRSFMARKVAEINQLISDGRFQVYDEVVMGTADAPVEEDLHVLQARELEEGTWLELQDDDGNPMRAKLSWKSLISGKYFFVNRQGLKVKEMTVFGLAAEFRAGRARIIEDVPVFDRAISTLMASLSGAAKT